MPSIRPWYIVDEFLSIQIFLFHNLHSFLKHRLDAIMHIYKRVYPSLRPSVCPSVGHARVEIDFFCCLIVNQRLLHGIDAI